MKNLFVLLCGLAIIGGSFAQGMGDDDKNKQDEQNMWKKPGPAKDDLLDKTVGKWKGEGNCWGKDVTVELEAKWIMNHQFVEQTSKWVGKDKSWEMEGRGLTQAKNKEGKRKVVWADDYGEIEMCCAEETKEGNLVVEWTAKTEQGDMEMRIATSFTEKGMVDEFFMKQEGKWVSSGKITYTKAK